jgi:hypothetical protein
MKSCRSGFIRCRSREEPWGSHHVDARALKCETSSGLTEEVLWARNWFCTNLGAALRRRLRLRREVGRRGAAITEPIDCFASRSAGLGNWKPSWRMRRFGEREVMPVMWFGRADKQIILAPVSKPASALKHPARMNRDLQGTCCSLMSSSCTSGAIQLYGLPNAFFKKISSSHFELLSFLISILFPIFSDLPPNEL